MYNELFPKPDEIANETNGPEHFPKEVIGVAAPLTDNPGMPTAIAASPGELCANLSCRLFYLLERNHRSNIRV